MAESESPDAAGDVVTVDNSPGTQALVNAALKAFDDALAAFGTGETPDLKPVPRRAAFQSN
ncbi:hypothetical protein P0W64_16580 [Tsukamurella sp. 8F]|uniref:hypothetical protein n=1 Tax=unclassified Tsukamurella TaxID=2633480 RepID=UPI0023B9B404|nr:MULTISPECIES: hypothetical protein [unclassified Tsukamurella]MDF0531152.1 hypothetical protein [Tsukamurella sp. 8J]MDF0588398.1 hypothetical protein [Tsukamurella sp. 8F]